MSIFGSGLRFQDLQDRGRRKGPRPLKSAKARRDLVEILIRQGRSLDEIEAALGRSGTEVSEDEIIRAARNVLERAEETGNTGSAESILEELGVPTGDESFLELGRKIQEGDVRLEAGFSPDVGGGARAVKAGVRGIGKLGKGLRRVFSRGTKEAVEDAPRAIPKFRVVGRTASGKPKLRPVLTKSGKQAFKLTKRARTGVKTPKGIPDPSNISSVREFVKTIGRDLGVVAGTSALTSLLLGGFGEDEAATEGGKGGKITPAEVRQRTAEAGERRATRATQALNRLLGAEGLRTRALSRASEILAQGAGTEVLRFAGGLGSGIPDENTVDRAVNGRMPSVTEMVQPPTDETASVISVLRSLGVQALSEPVQTAEAVGP